MGENVKPPAEAIARRPESVPEGLRVLCQAAVLNAFLVVVVLVLGTPSYETNDDLTMQLLSCGFYTGHPSEHLVFTSVIIGRVLRALYEVWNRPNWYFDYLVFVHYASLTAIAFVILRRGRRWLSALLYIGFFLLVESRSLLSLQFTTTAFAAGTAGVLMLADGLILGKAVSLGRVIGGLFFLALAVMIREPVVPMLGLLTWPLLLERFGLRGWRRALMAGLACSALLLALVGINRWYYQRDPAWAEFLSYNKLRGKIHLTPLARFISRADSTVGWTQNDGQMFVEFYFPDPEVYLPSSKLRTLIAELRTLARTEPPPWKFSVSDLFLPNLFKRDSADLMVLALLNAGACLVVVGRGRRQRWLLVFLASYLMCVLISVYLRQNARLPERVSFNLSFLLNVICLYWFAGTVPHAGITENRNMLESWLQTVAHSRAIRLLAGTLFAGWCVLYVSMLIAVVQNLRFVNSTNHGLKQISRGIFQTVETLLPPGRRPVLVPLPFDSLLEQSLLYYPSPVNASFALVPYGWLTHSPVYQQVLVQNHLTADPASLVDHPDVFFLMRDKWLEPLRVYYREHKKLDVRFETVLRTDDIPQYRRYGLHFYRAKTEAVKQSESSYTP